MTETTDTRPLPAALDVEQQVLAAMMMRDEAISRAALVIDRHAFASTRHREIWSAIMSLRERSTPADMTTVADELARMGKLEDIGGRGYLADVAGAVGTSANVEAHARIVLDRAIRRRAIVLTQRASVQFGALDTDTPALVASVEGAMADLARTTGRGRAIQTIAELARDDAARIAAGEPDRRVIPTGFPYGVSGVTPFDRCLGGGVAPGELHVFGGMESSGKTALWTELAYCMARRGGRVAYMPLEGGRESIIRRLRTQLSGVASRPDRYTDDERARIVSALDDIARAKLPFVVDDMRDERPLTPDKLRVHIHMMRGEYGTQAVIVDHLSMFDTNPQNAAMEQADALRKLVDIAVSEDVAVILLHHLTPEYALRCESEPTYATLNDFQLARHALGKYPYAIYALCNPHAGTTISRSKIMRFRERQGDKLVEVGRIDFGSGAEKPRRADIKCLKLKEGANDWCVPFAWVAEATLFSAYPQDGNGDDDSPF